MKRRNEWKRIYRLPSWVWKKWKKDYNRIYGVTMGHVEGHGFEYSGKRFSYKVDIDLGRKARYFRKRVSRR